MGDTKLCLLLLLCAYALAQEGVSSTEEQSPACLLATRFKSFKKYVYQYEAETLNGVSGASNHRNGAKVTCKVVIDVPQTCSYIVSTPECTLSEVSDIDAEGLPVYAPAAGADAFQAAMEKNPLKLTVEGESKVSLFPEADEPTNILNIKRGIISALLVPVLEEEKNSNMATLHGLCSTDFTVNTREDIATDVTVTRDLSHCDSFRPSKDLTSPLALISGLNLPLSTLISSTQTCNYKFDNKKKHMTEGTCTEKHIFLPFSHEEEYGISALVKQTVTLQESSKINDRVFDYNEANLKALQLEAVEDKAPIQTKDAVLATLRELSTLSQTHQGKQRASLFLKLVTQIRGLKIEALGPAVPEMVEVSGPLTWQALAQCGTPECSSAILQVLSTMDKTAVEVDAAVYAMGLLTNPSNHLVQGMLSMAQHKPSKPIMYALSHSVRRFYQAEGKVTPEITAVAEYIASLLGSDCAGDKDQTFLTLRVLGNMGKAMEAADPALKSTLIKCMRQPVTTLSVQQAAIQAFRQMSVTGEVRSNIQKVFQYSKGAVQKRIAAYLILMKDPEATDIEIVKKILTQEQNMQVKSFVASHIYNIVNSKGPETEELRRKIIEAMQDNEVTTHFEYTKFSRNYKLDTSVATEDPLMATMQGNMIFDPTGYVPKEVMLETTLKAFGYNLDMLEVGIEGKGFEPTIEALFGENGFFPDTVSKAMYWVEDKMPNKVNEVLKNWINPQRNERMKRQVPENLLREIARNANKLVKELQSQDSPEAMAYLRIMGAELGYLKASELKNLAQSGTIYAEIFSKMMPTKFLKSLLSSTENEFFVHYIFMDNDFSLPTASGFPLKVSLSGTFAPGAKGGLTIAPGMHKVSFMPSVGVEFVTQMGIHIPEFVISGIEMHTSIYHESALNARLDMSDNQIKLAIPAPQGTTQLFGISNRLLSVTSGQSKVLPPMAEGRTDSVTCSPLFSGVQYCTTLRYSDASSNNAAPYFPLTGETEFALEIQPTGEVTEYTAAFTYELLKEGKDGRQKVDTLKMTLKTEGAEPSEATATLKYNRNRNTLSTDIQIPDYDVEAGIRLGITDSSTKGKKITFDITNKNIPQLSLVGRAKLEEMKDGLLQVQLSIPSLKTDATVTAMLKRAEDLTLELESSINIPETSYVEKVIFRYDEDRVEVELKSDLSSEVHKLIPDAEAYPLHLQQLLNDILDQRVAKTDMTMRHIFSKSVEATSIWLDKFAVDVPYMENLRNIPDFTLPAMPEKLFLYSESVFRYQFNKDHITLTVPLPLGGTSSTDLGIPPTVTIPQLSIPKIGLEIPSREVSIPAFSIPPSYELPLPLIGMAEVSAKVNSNFYNWEWSVSGGNNTVDTSSYILKYQVMADCPLELLSYKIEGTGTIDLDTLEYMKTLLNGSLSHKLIDARFSFAESVSGSDLMKGTGNYKIEASSPLGLSTSLIMTSQATLSLDEIMGDSNLDGMIKLGPLSGTTTYSVSYALYPSKTEGRGESTLRVDSQLLEVLNKIKGTYANGELSVESSTNMNNNHLKHVTKVDISYKDAHVSLKSDSISTAIGTTVRNQVEVTASTESASIRVESQADKTPNRAYSLLSGSLNARGLEINTDASINSESSHGSHKATLRINADGISTSGTTTLQSSPLTFENVFNGGVDGTGAAISLSSKGTFQQNSADLSVEGKFGGTEAYLNSVFNSNLFAVDSRNTMKFRLDQEGMTISNNLIGSLQGDTTSYKHDITVSMKHYIMNVNVNNEIKLLEVYFKNEGQFMLEPYKMNLTGSLNGAFREEEIRHTYGIGYADLIANLKCSTTGKILGAQLAQSTDLEVAGFSSKLKSVTNLNSQPVHLDSSVEIIAAPFDLSIDASLSSDGDLNLYGIQHTGRLYSKFVLKAEPLSSTCSHTCRASTTHQLDRGAPIETSFDNKFDSVLNPQEQQITWRVTSKLNKHVYNQEVSAYNNHEKIGLELSGTVLTDLLNKPASENQEFGISGFLKYDKNSDSHIIQLPFIESLPAIFDQLKSTIVTLKDSSFALLQDINEKYEISTRIQEMAHELKEVIDSFEIKMFVEDLQDFISSINIDTDMEKVVALISTRTSSIVGSIKEEIKKFETAKLQELFDKLEIETTVKVIMEKALELIEQFKIKEIMQSVVDVLRSIDFKDLSEKAMQEVNKVVNLLKAIDLKQMINDMKDYIDKILKKVESFDYKAFADEVRQKLEEVSQVPAFGKLYGGFQMKSPHYNLKTAAELKNSTTNPITPLFTASLTSEATSDINLLAYTLDATARLAAPKMKRLLIEESLKVGHTAFSVEQQSTVTLYSASAHASAKITAKATTEPYTADLVSSVSLVLDRDLSSSLETTYNHNLNMPLIDISSQVSANQKSMARLESGVISVTVENTGNGKWSFLEFSDEGTHESKVEFTVNVNTAKLTFNSDINSKLLKTKQSVKAESVLPRHITVDGRSEIETPFIKESIMVLSGQVQMEDLKIQVTASHDSKLAGTFDGTLSNSVNFLAHPFEFVLNCKNSGNGKAMLPFKLTGKISLQNDYTVTLNSEVQQVSWEGQARFNQYKYSHRFTMDNNKNSIAVYAAMNGEANLDLLNNQISIPEITVPFTDMKIPSVQEFNPWEDAGLKSLLTTTHQTFDLNVNLQYQKNPDMYTIRMDFEPVYKAIDGSAKIMNQNFALARDIAVALLTASYNQAKGQYEKFKIDTSKLMPTTFTVPGYTVPILNIEVSPFTAELPAFSFVIPKEINSPSFRVPLVDYTVPSYIIVLPVLELPVLHVPTSLSSLTLPRFTLPTIQQSITMPAMGNLTYDFSFKSAMITLSSSAGLYNQDDLVAKFAVSSASVFDILKGKLDGTSTLTRKRNLKLVTTMSLEHMNAEGTHDSTIALNRKGMEASVTTVGKVSLPTSNLEFNQKFTGNTKDGFTATVFSPSTGSLGFQLQRKALSQVSGRLFSRYLSAPENDVDILTIKVSLKDPEKLNLQASWNMEAPYEMLLGLKEKVPEITSVLSLKDTFSNTIEKVYSEIPKSVDALQSGIEQIKNQGKVMYKRAAKNIADINLQEMSRKLSTNVRYLLTEYQNNIQALLDAVITFLRETEFLLPGFKEKLTGMEIYQRITLFVMGLIENAVQNVPELLASHTYDFLDYVRNIEITLPGSNHVISGRAILDDLTSNMKKIQTEFISVVRNLQAVRLDEVLERLRDLLLSVVDKADQLITSLTSLNLDKLSAWADSIYYDAVNSKAVRDISARIMEAAGASGVYLEEATAKIQEVYSQMTLENLNTILKSWIDAIVKHLNSFHNDVIEFLKQISQNMQPYVRVSDKKMDIDIPFPFLWKSSDNIPTQNGQ
ncbi:apolipoprotein B-100-like [Megalops cyprinoides]|uniref:apolipoprotein B-100-like n=1 Tax=Megalops cyprinoides TaxID=118141 RepID=UPI001864AEC8|nr:apolipoprotein B-100-like [Megalops cyprinoides]